MIVYREPLQTFIDDCEKQIIANKIAKCLHMNSVEITDTGISGSWKKSLPELANVLKLNIGDDFIQQPDVAVEYRLDSSLKAIDFLIYGKNSDNLPSLVIIELKQWSQIHPTFKPNMLFTNPFGSASKDCLHPSIQAFNYSNIMLNRNKYIQDNKVIIKSCSYLHNLETSEMVNLYKDEKQFLVLNSSPGFAKQDRLTLKAYILDKVNNRQSDLLDKIDTSPIKNSKHLEKMLYESLKEGKLLNSLDENQAISVANIIGYVINNKPGQKTTIIIKGGPGTGKSVVAINAMGQLINKYKKNVIYSTQNKAPRELFKNQLANDNFDKYLLKDLFKHPAYIVNKWQTPKHYDCIIVDEAHRLQKQTFRASNDILGDIFSCSDVNVFFIDEDQQVTKKDYATIDIIKEYAKKYNSEVIEADDLKLSSQFRCLGGSEFISFVRTFLGYDDKIKIHRWTKNNNFELKVCDSAKEMYDIISQKNKEFKKSRLVAGYTHEWISKDNPSLFDFEYSDGFNAKWNMPDNWAGSDNTLNEVGCIHTAQGIDLNYVGVIIGKDMRYENNKIIFDKAMNARSDNTSGIRNERNDELAKKLIRNTYQVLLTRGMKGCYIYCEDKNLNEYLKTLIS